MSLMLAGRACVSAPFDASMEFAGSAEFQHLAPEPRLRHQRRTQPMQRYIYTEVESKIHHLTSTINTTTQ